MIEHVKNISRTWYGALFWVVAILMIALSPELFGARFFYHIDVLTENIQLLIFFQRTLGKTLDFLWNPLVFSGFPSFALANNGYFAPWSLFFIKIFSPFNALIWSIFVSAALCGFLMMLFLKRLSISFVASLVGGLMFIFAQWGLIYDYPIVNSFYLFPLLFLSLLDVYENKLWRGLILGIVGSGIALLSAHPQFVIEGFFAAALFALFLSIKNYSANQKKSLVKIFFFYGLFFFGGVVITLGKLVPTYVMLRESVHATIDHWDAASVGLRVLDFPRLFFPYDIALFGLSPEQFMYVGVLPLFFIAIGWSWHIRTPRGFFSYLAIFSLLLSFKNSYLYWMLHHLPIMNSTRYASRWYIVFFFALSVLTAFGMDYLYQNFNDYKMSNAVKYGIHVFRSAAIIFLGFGIIATVILRFGLDWALNMLFSFFDHILYTHTSQIFTLDYYHTYIKKNTLDLLYNFDFTSLHVMFAVLFLFVAFIFLNKYRNGNIKQEHFLITASVIIILNFLLVIPSLQLTLDAQILTKQVPTVKYLQSVDAKRIFNFLAREGSYQKLELIAQAPRGAQTDDLFRYFAATQYPNLNIMYNISSAEMYTPMMSRSMARLLAFVGSDRAIIGPSLFVDSTVSVEKKIDLFAKRVPVLRFLGVDYILSPYSLPNDTFIKVFETKVTTKNIPIYVYQNKNPRPLFYWGNEALLNIPEDTNMEKFNHAIDIEINTNSSSVKQDGLILQNKTNTSFEFATQQNEDSRILVLSETYAPGWRVFIDGRPTALQRFGMVFLAAEVPAGNHLVRFEYSYREIWRYFFEHYL